MAQNQAETQEQEQWMNEKMQELTQKNWEQNPWMTWTEARSRADQTIRSWRQ